MDGQTAQGLSLEAIFTPGIPVAAREGLAGRAQQLDRADRVLSEPGRHLLLLGEPGVGRTSFALACLEGHRYRYHQAGLDDSFERMLGRLLEPRGDPDDAPGTAPRTGAGSRAGADGVADLVDGYSSDADRLLVIDDLDRADAAAISDGIVPLIRALSDSGSGSKLLLTAREDRPFPEALHGTGLRLYALSLGRLDPELLDDFIVSRTHLAGLRFSRELRSRILADADGLPGLVHALCLEAARSAVARGSQHAGIGRDYLPAVSALGESLGPRLDAAYREVTSRGSRSDRYAHLLWAGALCPGPSFHTDELERGLARIEGHPVPHQGFAVHLGDLLKRGLWTRVQENLYRFADPALKVYVRLRLRKEAPRLLGEDPLQLGLF